MTIDDILAQINSATSPTEMGQREALDFLEELRDELNVRIDALLEDLGRGEKE